MCSKGTSKLRRVMSFVMSFVLVLTMAVSLLPAADAQAAGTDSITLGSKGTSFEKGKTYLVPISLKHAYKDQDSAAASCPGKYGTLTIGEDGTATLSMTCRSVTQAGITDYAYNFNIYQGNLSSNKKAATVVKTQDVAWDSSTKTVPQTISFEIPSAMKTQDYVYLTMKVDAMSDMGMSDPDARLFIEYADAKESGDDSLNYEKKYSGQVQAFGKYWIDVTVKVEEGVITDLTISGRDFANDSSGESNEKIYLPKAIKKIEDQIIGKGIYDTDTDLLNDIDVVSGATVSAELIKESVMNAIGVEVKKEVIPDAPKTVPAAGTYSIQIKNITDEVAHSLIGKDGTNYWKTAYLTVDKSGNMYLSYRHENCTLEEPLHVLGFNGYYKGRDNDGNGGTLKKTTQIKTAKCSDHGTTVVTDVKIPLIGSTSAPQQKYYVNTYLYVEAMKNVDGLQAGIQFDHGKFNIDSTITLNWDTLTKVSKDAYFPQESKTAPAKKVTKKLTVGKKYKAGGNTYKALTASTVSLVKAAKKKKISVPNTVTVGGVKASVTVIGNNAFSSAKKKVTSVTIGTNVTTIGKKAFAGCKKLKKITVKSKKLKKVGAKALSGIHKKAVIKVPKKQKKKYTKLFKNKGQKKTVKAASENDSIFSKGDVVDTKPQPAKVKKLTKGKKYTSGGNTYQALSANTVSLVKAAAKKSVSVPATVTVGGVKASVTAIGNNAFSSAKKKVTSVTIGTNVTKIGKKAFANCKKLKKITVKSTKLKSVGAKALSGIHKKAVIKVPKKQKKKYTKLFKNKGQKKTVKIK